MASFLELGKLGTSWTWGFGKGYELSVAFVGGVVFKVLTERELVGDCVEQGWLGYSQPKVTYIYSGGFDVYMGIIWR